MEWTAPMYLCRAFYSCKMLLQLTLVDSFQGESKESKSQILQAHERVNEMKKCHTEAIQEKKKTGEIGVHRSSKVEFLASFPKELMGCFTNLVKQNIKFDGFVQVSFFCRDSAQHICS